MMPGLAYGSATLTLSPCHVEGLAEQVECGFLTVPENYEQPEGRTIDLHVVRLPAIAAAKEPDPLLFLAGGPGQAATELTAMIASVYSGVRQTRDILLIDQRGTGQSNPLRCDIEDLEEVRASLLVAEESLDLAAETRRCATQYEVDFQQYDTKNAVHDFDAVRAALGYEQINIYGGSYGTRSGLAFLRDFPNSIRAAVLDGLAPPQMKIGLFGQSAAVAFERMIQDCREMDACASTFGDVRAMFDQVSAELAANPMMLTINDPRSHYPTEVRMSAQRFQQMMFGALYHPRTRQLLPYVIHAAAQGNFSPLAGLVGSFESQSPLYLGLTLSVICQEDLPRLTQADRAAEAASSFMGDAMLETFSDMCEGWPVVPNDSEVAEPITAEHPVLLLSGGQDPVTPSSMAELAAETLANSQHLVAEHAGHTIVGQSCANRLIQKFLNNPEAEVDGSCLANTEILPFVLNVNGQGM